MKLSVWSRTEGLFSVDTECVPRKGEKLDFDNTVYEVVEVVYFPMFNKLQASIVIEPIPRT